MLSKIVTSLLVSIFGEVGFFFLQDNCSVQTYLKREKFHLLEWVAYSPDMNIQENIWSMISEKVYDGKQYFDKKSLWQSIVKAVEEINKKEKDKVAGFFKEI